MTSLEGIRVIVTRPERQAARLATMIQSRGGEAVVRPLIDIEYQWDVADASKIIGLASYDAWISTSTNGVLGLVLACEAMSVSLSMAPPGFVVGDATGRAAAEHGLSVMVPPGVHNAADLASSLIDRFRGERRRVLCVEGSLTGHHLSTALKQAGHKIDRCVVYRTDAASINVSEWETWLAGPAADHTGVVFYSPSAADSLAHRCDRFLHIPPRRAMFVCVGATTSSWFSTRAIPVNGIATHPSDEAVCDTLSRVWCVRMNEAKGTTLL